MPVKPDKRRLQQLIDMALEEDAPWGDISSSTFIPADANVRAKLVAREAGVLCGEDIFTMCMATVGDVATDFFIHDGDSFTTGQTLAEASGPARAVLQAERVALNFTQRLSGIATLTAKYVAAVQGTKARFVDTRKTTPGLRILERYAVRCGGGHNHRYSLSDAVMLKDNHLAALNASSNADLADKIRQRREELPHTTHIEIEVDRPDQIDMALAAGADTIMLDNFSVPDMRSAVEKIAGRAVVEASGGVSLERVAEIAATGIDVISVGALTHSVRSLDLGLDM